MTTRGIEEANEDGGPPAPPASSYYYEDDATIATTFTSSLTIRTDSKIVLFEKDYKTQTIIPSSEIHDHTAAKNETVPAIKRSTSKNDHNSWYDTSGITIVPSLKSSCCKDDDSLSFHPSKADTLAAREVLEHFNKNEHQHDVEDNVCPQQQHDELDLTTTTGGGASLLVISSGGSCYSKDDVGGPLLQDQPIVQDSTREREITIDKEKSIKDSDNSSSEKLGRNSSPECEPVTKNEISIVDYGCLEFPKRCYLTPLNHDDLKISCNRKGDIYTTTKTTNRKGWEEWFIIEDLESPGQEQVKFKNCAHGKFLTSSNDGYTKASTPEEEDSHREWRLCTREQGNKSDESSSSMDTYSIFNIGIQRYLTIKENKDVCAITKESIGEDKEGPRQPPPPPPGWKIELLTGELCFISSPTTHRHLSCHALTGGLSMTLNRKGWEVWRFIEVGGNNDARHVHISNWTHDKRYLCSDGNGKVWTTSDNPVGRGSWDKWSVELAPRGFHGVAIKSVSHNRYLQVGSDGRTPISTCELFGVSTLWHLDAANSQNFTISSMLYDKRIGCGKQGQIYSTKNRKEWEISWELQQQEDGFISLRSRAHDQVLCSDENGNLFVTDMVEKNGLWKLEHSTTSSSGLHIISKKTGRYLSCEKNNHGLRTTVSPSKSAAISWSLEPILPDTITASQLTNNIIGGSLAVVSIVAAPFAVMGTIGAMGFGASGITSGSIAAGMMSAEAISSGGAIAAGSTVATLQSIGTAGLGVAGTAASMSAGAVVGGSAWGIAAAASASKGPLSKGERSSNVATERSTRPFCNWQSW